MKYKITKNEYLQKLLLSTGNAFLLETTPGFFLIFVNNFFLNRGWYSMGMWIRWIRISSFIKQKIYNSTIVIAMAM